MAQSETYSPPVPEVSEEIPEPSQGLPNSIMKLLIELAQHKIQIFFITLTCMVIGLILCFTLPETYNAVTMIMTPTQVPSMGALIEAESLGSLASLAGGGLGLRDPNLIFIGMLQSRTIADALISQFHLKDLYHSKDMTTARLALAKHTEVDEEKSSLISITVTDTDPNRAAVIANAYVDQLRLLTKDMAAKEDARQRTYYEGQLKSQREALINAEIALQKVQQNKGIVQPMGQATALLGTMETLRAEIAAQQVEVDALRSYSTDKNPDYQIAQKRLEALKQEASRMSQHGSSKDFGDIGLKDVPAAGLDYIRAQREVEYQTTLYTVLLKQYEAARLDATNEAYSIQVVDQAVAPDERAFPRRTMLMAIATLIGLALSYGWIFVSKLWQRWSSTEEFAVSLASLKSALRFW